MACSDFDKLYEFWSHGQFFDGVNCYFANQLGEPATQLIVFTTLALSLYVYSREPIVPVVMAVIFAGIFIAPLPSAVVNMAVLFGVVVTAVVLYLVVMRAKGEVTR